MDIRNLLYSHRKNVNSIDVLSVFAGRHLALALWMIATEKQLAPFGATRKITFWHGAEDAITRFQAERLEHRVEAAMNWYGSAEHKAHYVAAVIDTFVTIEGVRTDAVRVAARFGDSSAGIVLLLPYASVPENAELKLGSPVVDFPAQFPSLATQRARILAGLRRGRDTIRNKDMLAVANWK